MEQPNKIELEVEKEPTDFFNYRWDGTSLIYDPQWNNRIRLNLK